MSALGRQWPHGCEGTITMCSLYSMKPGGMDDNDIIQKALHEHWIIITNDKDFGNKVYRDGRLHRGVILLRLADERSAYRECSRVWWAQWHLHLNNYKTW